MEKLTAHSFIPKWQSNYFRELNGNLEVNEVIILGDFAKNYSFVNLQCTVHPAVVYYKDGSALQWASYCIISDDNKHDVVMVYQVKKEINNWLEITFSLP